MWPGCYSFRDEIKMFLVWFKDQTEALILKVYEFTDVVSSAAFKKEPHLITNYVYELASMFHNYYGKHRILTEDIKESEERLALIKAVKITIKNALRLIGVKAIDKM
jgi:arginyl-tRNA synthetase